MNKIILSLLILFAIVVSYFIISNLINKNKKQLERETSDNIKEKLVSPI